MNTVILTAATQDLAVHVQVLKLHCLELAMGHVTSEPSFIENEIEEAQRNLNIIKENI